MSKRELSFSYSKVPTPKSPRTTNPKEPSRIPVFKNYAKSASSSPRQCSSFRSCATQPPTSKPILQQGQQKKTHGKDGNGDKSTLQDLPVPVQSEKIHSTVDLNDVTFVDKPINEEEIKKALGGLISPLNSQETDDEVDVGANLTLSKEESIKEKLQEADKVQEPESKPNDPVGLTDDNNVSDMDIIFAPSPLRMNSTDSILPGTLQKHNKHSYLKMHRQKLKEIQEQMQIAIASTNADSVPEATEDPTPNHITPFTNENTLLTCTSVTSPLTSAIKAAESYSKESLLEDVKAPSILNNISIDGCYESDENCVNLVDQSVVETVKKHESEIFIPTTTKDSVPDYFIPLPTANPVLTSTKPSRQQAFTVKPEESYSKELLLEVEDTKTPPIVSDTTTTECDESAENFNDEVETVKNDEYVEFIPETANDPEQTNPRTIDARTVMTTIKVSNQQLCAVKAEESRSKVSLLEDTEVPSIVYVTTECDKSNENSINLNDEFDVESLKNCESDVEIFKKNESEGFILEATTDSDPDQISSLSNADTVLTSITVSRHQTYEIKPEEISSKEQLLEDTEGTVVYDITTYCGVSCENYAELTEESEPEMEITEHFESEVEITEHYESEEEDIYKKICIDKMEYEKESNDCKKPRVVNIFPDSISQAKKKQRTIFSMDVQQMLHADGAGDSVLMYPNGEYGDGSSVSPTEKKKTALELPSDNQYPLQRISSADFGIENVAESTVFSTNSPQLAISAPLNQVPHVTETELFEGNSLSECVSVTPQNSTLILSPHMIKENKVFECLVKIHNASSQLYGYKILCNLSAFNHFTTTPRIGFIQPHSQVSIKVRTNTTNLVTSEVAANDKIVVKIFPSYCDDITKLRTHFEFLSEQHPEVITTQLFDRVIIWDARNLTEMLKLLNSIRDPQEVATLKDTLYFQYQNEVLPQVRKKQVLHGAWTEMLTMNQNLRNVYSQMVSVRNLQNTFLFMVVIFTAFLWVVPFLKTNVVVVIKEEEDPQKELKNLILELYDILLGPRNIY